MFDDDGEADVKIIIHFQLCRAEGQVAVMLQTAPFMYHSQSVFFYFKPRNVHI